ncbi:MAG: hypothetical protein IPL52_12175 [Flavobacteriales bacterium]|nr:hypothetical protein [Flavobacteriales bacterium]
MNLALAVTATAQNLVPNPSFEDTTLCDVYDPLRTQAVFWYNPNTSTPDIWDCDTVRRCGQVMDPTDSGIQIQGYKYAYDGDRFAGCFHWYGPNSSNTRDYFTAKLTSPLQVGTSYSVTLWCARPNGMNAAIDHIGVHFGTDSIHEPYSTTLPFVPQAQLRDPNSTYITDTSWVQLVDTFVAVGGEQWVTVGTFLDANDVDGIWLGWGSFPGTAYYCIDLLEVQPLLGQSVVTSPESDDRLVLEGPWMVWYGQTADGLAVVDASGREVWRFNGGTVVQGRYPIPNELAAGAYVACVNRGQSRYGTRFVK